MLWSFQLQVFNSHVCFCDIYLFIIISDTNYAVVEMMNVTTVRFLSGTWVMVACTETVVSAAGFTVQIYVCSCSTVQVRGYTIVLF